MSSAPGCATGPCGALTPRRAGAQTTPFGARTEFTKQDQKGAHWADIACCTNPGAVAVGNGARPPPPERGALIRYARVSTSGQNLDRQARALIEAGCIRIFADKQPGKTVGRPELAACLDYLRAGDTLVVRAWTGCPGPCRT